MDFFDFLGWFYVDGFLTRDLWLILIFLLKYNGGEYIANFKGGGYTQINAWMIGYRYQGCYGHTNL